MKMVIPVNGTTGSGRLSPFFARSSHYAIIDLRKGDYEIIENPYYDLAKGAGFKILDYLVNVYGVTKIIAFEIGLNVQQVAREKGIQLIIINRKNQTLDQIFNQIFLSDTESKLAGQKGHGNEIL